MVSYFWDTYAIVEFIEGNENYAKFKDEPVSITIFNLAEIYWFALNEYNEDEASKIFERFKLCAVYVDEETLKSAIQFRKKHNNKDMSYTDCIGYSFALKHNLKFLTGDKEFRNMENVEFVK